MRQRALMVYATANHRAPDRFDPVSTQLLDVMADEGRPMTVDEMSAGLEPARASLELSVARVAGFVRAVPTDGAAQRYAPTPLGFAIARRAQAFAAAQDARSRAMLA